jgi:hypothetical protein
MINPDGTSGGGTGSNSSSAGFGEKLTNWFKNITTKQVLQIVAALVLVFLLSTLL